MTLVEMQKYSASNLAKGVPEKDIIDALRCLVITKLVVNLIIRVSCFNTIFYTS